MSNSEQSATVVESTETMEEKGPPGCHRAKAIRQSVRIRAKAKDRGEARSIERNWWETYDED